jgi:hypothetical protein
MIHTYLRLNTILIRTNGRSQGRLKHYNAFSDIGETMETEVLPCSSLYSLKRCITEECLNTIQASFSPSTVIWQLCQLLAWTEQQFMNGPDMNNRPLAMPRPKQAVQWPRVQIPAKTPCITTELLRSFTQSLQVNSMVEPQVRPRLLPSTSCPTIH